MNKNDYIKVLREFQNDLKNEINSDVDFFKECNYEERIEDIYEQKNEYICKAITYFMFLYILLQKDYKLVSTLLGLFGAINLTKYGLVSRYEKEFKENYFIVESVNSKFKKEVERLENGINLFQSSSEEEIKKYLSYKMGDSEKK